jgi:hypothetical protein
VSKVELNTLVTGNSVSLLNQNFQKIENALNDKVLYRDNVEGESNEMENNLDMNGNRIYNLPAPVDENEPARLKELQDVVRGDVSLNPAVRVPENSLNVLPNVAGRSNKFLSFDGAGQPVAVELSLGGTQTIVDTVAVLRTLTNDSSIVTTQGYWEKGDKGAARYLLQPISAAPADNKGTVIVRNDGRWYKIIVEGDFINAAQLGVYSPSTRLEVDAAVSGYKNRWSGAKPSTYLAPTALPAPYSTVDFLHSAMQQVRDLGKGLLIDGVIHCDKQVVVDAPTRIQFAGHTGNLAGNSDVNLPDSYFFQANTAMVGSVVVQLVHDGITVRGGGVIGTVYYSAVDDFYYPEGPARDGVFIGGNGASWTQGCFGRMGRDGIRQGDYVGGAGTNSNSIKFPECVTAYNGNNGLTVNDASGALDANVFDYGSLFTHHNQNSGIELANTYLGGTFTAPTVENNGRGWFFNNSASGIVIIGGDTEANNGWRGLGTLLDIVEDPAVVGKNFFCNHTVNGTVRNDLPDGSSIRNDQPTNTDLLIQNLNTNPSAESVLNLRTTAGFGAIRKRSDATGGELLIGNVSGYPIGFLTNNTIHMGITANGALSMGGFSAVGTPGQVLTSQGPGSAPVWSPVTAVAGGSTPMIQKGDLFCYSTTTDRLAVGTNGQVLTADSATPTGLKWSTITGSGTVTSVGMTVPTGFAVSGTPITASGTLALTYGAGYQGFLTADKTKLDSITVSNLALLNASNNFTGTTQSIINSNNGNVGYAVVNTNAGSSAAAQITFESNAGVGGILNLSLAAGGQLIFGSYNTRPIAIMHNGVFRIFIDSSGNIEFRGLPGSSGGNPERVWRDVNGFLRIGG